MPIQLLAIGDMHLGRQPSRLPDGLATRSQDLSPRGAWWRAVQLAIEKQVDIVALAGDLVDQEDDLFEAYQPLEEGIRQLVQAGIEVIGITGNHDVAVLPKLAKHLSDFKLLGAQGIWGTHSIEKQGEQLTIHGWSFPKAQVTQSPLAGHTFQRSPGLNIGLLHCDRDQADSVYAPVSSAELRGAGLDAWLLGHIHRPDALSLEQPSGYLGSLTGLHVGESGIRGPWLLTIDQGRITDLKHCALAPLVWWPLNLDLSDLTGPSEAFERLLGHVRSLDQMMALHDHPPEAIGLRVTLIGETDHGQAVEVRFQEQADQNWATGSIQHVFVESITDATRPVVDLSLLAEQSDHLGQLAHHLLLLESRSNDVTAQALIQQARTRLSTTIEDRRWQLLSPVELTDEIIREDLITSGHRLLRTLLKQKAEHDQ